ncbi:SAM-dependent methyltransferase [Actinomadura sp. CNU-125]|uniref:SAM-dependent methyltransferase n=1 Tax=Actinomadura sp. CNU-125 TaxID=1904961 RepID=UPI000B18D5E9|nr:SAM-dependent methyltransferase [Actinomadura sp. CNU-125]
MADEQVEIPENVPTSARTYGWMLGGKDNFEVDRRFTIGMLEQFHSGVDITRENRRFLYRAVRYMTEEAGIRQFLDMGCGLPTNDNVHQVAQRLAPESRVVYVDNDPIVLAHGRALLATDDSTTMIQADFRDQDALLAEPALQRLIDFDEPLGLLFLSVGHHLTDDDAPRRVLGEIIGRAVPGSHLAFSQMVCDPDEQRAAMNAGFTPRACPCSCAPCKRSRTSSPTCPASTPAWATSRTGAPIPTSPPSHPSPPNSRSTWAARRWSPPSTNTAASSASPEKSATIRLRSVGLILSA